MGVSSRRLARVLHRHLSEHGLLSFLSLLRAFRLHVIKRNFKWGGFEIIFEACLVGENGCFGQKGADCHSASSAEAVRKQCGSSAEAVRKQCGSSAEAVRKQCGSSAEAVRR